jgi:hypothetical protein
MTKTLRAEISGFFCWPAGPLGRLAGLPVALNNTLQKPNPAKPQSEIGLF